MKRILHLLPEKWKPRNPYKANKVIKFIDDSHYDKSLSRIVSWNSMESNEN